MTSTSSCRNFCNSYSGISFIFLEEGGATVKKTWNWWISWWADESFLPDVNSADITKTTMAIFPAIFVNWFLEQKLTDYLLIFRKLIPIRWTFLNFTWKKHSQQTKHVCSWKLRKKFGGWLSYWVDTTVNWVTLANFSAATTHVAGSRSRRRLRGARAPSSESRGMHTIRLLPGGATIRTVCCCRCWWWCLVLLCHRRRWWFGSGSGTLVHTLHSTHTVVLVYCCFWIYIPYTYSA